MEQATNIDYKTTYDITEIVIIEDKEYLQKGYSDRYKKMIANVTIKVVQKEDNIDNFTSVATKTTCFHLDVKLWRGTTQGVKYLKEILEKTSSPVIIYSATEMTPSIIDIENKYSGRVKSFPNAKSKEDQYFPEVVDFWNNYLEMQSEISNKTKVFIESCINKQGTECIGIKELIFPQIYEGKLLSLKERLFIVKNFLSLTIPIQASYWITQEYTIVAGVDYDEGSVEDFWIEKEINNLGHKSLIASHELSNYSTTIQDEDSLDEEINRFVQNLDKYSLIYKHLFLLFFAQNLVSLYDNKKENQEKWRNIIDKLIPFSDDVISLEFEIMTGIWEKFTLNNHDLEETKKEMKYLYKQGFMQIENIFYGKLDEITKDKQAVVVLRGVNRMDEPFKRIFNLDLLQKNQIKEEKQYFRLVGCYPKSGSGNFDHSVIIELILSETLEQKENV